jgi:hypothetical protein
VEDVAVKVCRLPIKPGEGYLRVAIRVNGAWGYFSPPIPAKDELFLTVALEMAFRLFPNRKVLLVAALIPEEYERGDLNLLHLTAPYSW